MTTRILRSMALAFGLALALSPLAFGQPSTQSSTAPTNASSARSVASGQKAKEVLTKVEGIRTVAAYPQQHSVGVQFAGKGNVSSQQLIDALAKEGIEASN